MKQLARSDYVETDYRGRMVALYCKCCGVRIGKEYRRGGFVRHTNYAELKLRFEDGSHHVTNCCKLCADIAINDPELMEAMHDADINVMVQDVPAMAGQWWRGKPMCVWVDKKRMGIL